jgi:DNA-binding HxlR family transcriptional regulator
MAEINEHRRTPKRKYARSGYDSPIDAVLEVIGGKYKVAILYHLRESVVRFGELHRSGN